MYIIQSLHIYWAELRFEFFFHNSSGLKIWSQQILPSGNRSYIRYVLSTDPKWYPSQRFGSVRLKIVETKTIGHDNITCTLQSFRLNNIRCVPSTEPKRYPKTYPSHRFGSVEKLQKRRQEIRVSVLSFWKCLTRTALRIQKSQIFQCLISVFWRRFQFQPKINFCDCFLHSWAVARYVFSVRLFVFCSNQYKPWMSYIYLGANSSHILLFCFDVYEVFDKCSDPSYHQQYREE